MPPQGRSDLLLCPAFVATFASCAALHWLVRSQGWVRRPEAQWWEIVLVPVFLVLWGCIFSLLAPGSNDDAESDGP